MNVSSLQVMSRQVLRLMLCVTVLLPIGCGGGSDKIVGKVTGRVTYLGEPVTSGIVYLNSSQTGAGGMGKLGENGEFAIVEPIETGEYRVTVTPPPPPDPIAGQATPPQPKVLNIPEKYRTESSTDLKATIEEGDNTLDFDLKP